MPENEPTEGEGAARRACDQCRLRKIRCDKESPCSNCRTAHRTCSSTGAGQRPKEARQRVLISTQYERKINYFEARLANIEGLLRELTVSITNNGRSPSSSATESAPPGPVPVPGPSGASPAAADSTDVLYGAEDDGDAAPTFEGDSSLTAHTVFASEFLENTVTRSLPHDLDPDMRSALSSLQQIASMQNRPSPSEARFANAKLLPRGGIRELPMPPAQVVVGMLREVKDKPPQSFITICTMVATDNFAERCSKVYFATEDYSILTWGIVNAGLYFLFLERASVAEGARKAQLLQYQSVCRDNLETALTNLPLLLPARKESVEILLLGAFYAIEISKFSLARDLNSIAATLCQTLGYHRLRSPTPESEAKVVLFWAAYILDKALSLRSGRAPVIQDYDITVHRGLGPGINLPDASWRVVLNLWISYANFLGRAYEQLYSPAALARPQEQRVESARQLVQTMVNLAKEQEPLMRHTREKIRGTKFDANKPFTMDLAILSDELLHWSALTLIYRAIPSPPGSPSTFNQECIHAARRAFALHQEYMEMAGDNVAAKAGCIQWNLICVPFTPVIILFCHIVETSDEDDLRRLADFVESLQPACAVSEAVAKLHRICQVLHNVASLYVKAKAQRQQDPQQRDQDMAMVGDNIDMYLSQLGFMPQVDPAFGGEGDLPAAGFAAGQASELGNWFSGNTHILGLLEEDLSEFEPRMWSMGGQ
ncbi:f63a4906-a6fb-4e30-a403-60ac7174ad3a [Thermothielavioides terrestris]|uniref:F63a4906-a6fb-4e30-a403-60ac7174ad3a n=1 Tax=Thermothielavioides terrestris TaxID=2587410 RepID=A0A3S4AKN5_9PEZI|nr:f63a4906-a6fb-4e30-a403-60ac7174ad3a [Thermothielavioides terrestris]